MTMTVSQANREPVDQFPIGMRVLAVDDDPTCLRILEELLRRCQYKVTTTNGAMKALQLLRENKDNFDLVISDVQMPDMNGFKLLELVGLEMDLPVIMLSAYGDKELVMKGITHGACDYLLKPVRYEELKNIFQHVVRKKKNRLSANSNGANQIHSLNNELAVIEQPDQNERLDKKRKDHFSDNEDDEQDGNGNDEDDENGNTQKKPRVVWSVELHKKFVAAVNHLGLDKAVPKKILDMMGVEKLTRENVASHLQKYRLYLKRISTAANQQANFAAALGSPDSQFMQMSSLNGLGNMRPMASQGTLYNNNMSSRTFPGNGMLGMYNSPGGLGGGHSSGMIQLGHDQGKFQPLSLTSSQNRTILQGMPAPYELERLQQPHNNHIGGISSATDNPTSFPGVFLDNPMNPLMNNSSVLEGCSHDIPNTNMFVNEPAVTAPGSLIPGFSSGYSNQIAHLDNWPGSIQSTPHSMALQVGNVQVQHSVADDATYHSNVLGSHRPMHNLDQNNGSYPGDMGFNSLGSLPLECAAGSSSAMDAPLNATEGYLIGQQNPQNSFTTNNGDSLDAIANVLVKQFGDV